MNMQASDLSARLLATENLTVVRSNVRTASFDIKSRVLTLPMWKEMTPEIEDMLVGHEVGHALYTLDKYIEPIKEQPKLQGYMNILEDVRIEKLIKRKYPGLRKRMNEGYKQLNDKDFFGVAKTPLDSLLLIDKINLYFKAGFQCGVQFDADEKVFVNRAERTETIDEVIQLAKDLFAFAKEKAEQRKQERAAAGEADEEEDQDPTYMDDLDFGDDFDDQEEADEETKLNKESSKAGSGKKDTEDDDGEQPVTDRAFQDKLADLADESNVYQYHNLGQLAYDPIIGFKTILKELNFEFGDISAYYQNRVYGNSSEEEYIEKQHNDLNKFKTDSLSSVNYLIKEFEMKKSAEMYKRAQVSKSGSLDMRKVYAYKIQDDLFKRVTTLPQGKNHGMVFMLDWSGSMDRVIKDTIKQVINLAMFCNKAQIPYRVFAFTSQYRRTEEQAEQMNAHYNHLRGLQYSSQTEGEVYCTDFHLLELFSNKMSSSEFNKMIKNLLDPRVFWHEGYDLGGTPLNEGLAWAYHNLGNYMKEQRIEKMNFITLTDGCGGALQSTVYINRYSRTNNSNGKYVTVKNLMRDPVTKKTYEFNADSGQQTETLLKMIKDRHNVRVIGFYICENRRRALESAIRDNVYGFMGDTSLTLDSMRKSFRESGFYSMTGTGRDDLFIVPAESTKISDETLTVNSDMSARKLATTLGKFLNTKKTSRVLLSRFIDYVA